MVVKELQRRAPTTKDKRKIIEWLFNVLLYVITLHVKLPFPTKYYVVHLKIYCFISMHYILSNTHTYSL